MKVHELIKQLEGVGGDLEVLVDGAFDHGYHRPSSARVETVEAWPRERVFKEYWDDANMGEGGVKQQALVVSIQ